MNECATTPERAQRGLSLVELMVALVIGLIVIAGVFQIYLGSKQTFNAQASISRMQETGRYVTDVLVSDLRRSGHWGGNADVTTVGGSVPWQAVCPDNTNWARMLERRVSDLQAEAPNCFDNFIAGSGGILEVRFADGSSRDVTGTTNPLYLHSNLFEGRLETVADPNALQPISNEPITIRPLRARAYFVGASQDPAPSCQRGAVVPSLWRDGLEQAEELAQGVERLHLRFLEDGGNAYVDAAAVTDWGAIRSVRLWILVRAECPEPGFVNSTEYQLAGETFMPNDNFRRHLFVSTVQLRNL